MHPALRLVDHRPWPLPPGPWIMEQTWNDLLFAHWPVSPETLRPLVPPVLSLDTFQGQCWMAITPFHMTGIRFRCLPPLPGLSRFPELNVRTYVSFRGKPGVYFFSLDAGSRAAVWAARATYRLPYFHARMNVERHEGDWILYRSLRNRDTEFHVKYKPRAHVELRSPGTIANWLTERYCLYTVDGNSVFQAEIHHQQWPLQDAEAEISENTMAIVAGIKLPEIAPLLHFSKKLQVLIWPLKKA